MAVAAGTRAGWMPARFAGLGDERLARLAAAGHARAFAVVYERHHQALYRYCRSILRHDADAQDALQSTFAAAFAALARGQRDAPIRPWLFRIAHNEAVSVLRRRRPTAELSELSDASTASVEEQVAERDELSRLLHDLRKLTERQRSALVMRELSGLSHEEIAIALGTSLGAAKQTIYEARRSLFEFAEGRAMACDDIRKTLSDADGRTLRSRRVRAHLRECTRCSAFAAAIPARSADLRALTPALPTLAATGLLEQIVGAGSGHGAGAAGLTTLTAGKAATATLTANALAGVAVVASATVGVTIGVDRLVQTNRQPAVHRAVAPASSRPAPTAGAAGAVLRGHALAAGGARSAWGGGLHRPGTGGSSTAIPGHPPSRGHAGGRSPHSMTGGGAGRTTASGSVEHGAGRSTMPPGQTMTPPGQAKVPPGQARKSASGQAKAPPGQANVAPGQARKSASGQARTPPGQAATPRGQARTPRGQATTPSGQARTTPGQAKIPPGQVKPSVSAPVEASLPAPAAAAGAPAAAVLAPGGSTPKQHK